jgi:hypothetical protein
VQKWLHSGDAERSKITGLAWGADEILGNEIVKYMHNVLLDQELSGLKESPLK